MEEAPAGTLPPCLKRRDPATLNHQTCCLVVLSAECDNHLHLQSWPEHQCFESLLPSAKSQHHFQHQFLFRSCLGYILVNPDTSSSPMQSLSGAPEHEQKLSALPA